MNQRTSRPRRLILLGTLLGLVAVSLSAAGCSSRSGRRVANGSIQANFAVMNNSAGNIDVFVDNDRLGTVLPGQLVSFDVIGGTRPVHIRESGGALIYFGTYTFYFDQLLRIDYQTGLSNLEVTNLTGVTIHVHIDGLEVADIQPQTSAQLVVSPGFHDVHFRERGNVGLDFQGTFNFPSPSLSGGIQLTYGP